MLGQRLEYAVIGRFIAVAPIDPVVFGVEAQLQGDVAGAGFEIDQAGGLSFAMISQRQIHGDRGRSYPAAQGKNSHRLFGRRLRVVARFAINSLTLANNSFGANGLGM